MATAGVSRPGSGRGTSRKKYEEGDSRPPPNKQGFSGAATCLVANYFDVQAIPNCVVIQYDVKFNPDVESLPLRKGMLRDHQAMLGRAYLFDGMALWAPVKLKQEVTEVFSSNRSTGEKHQITIKFIGEVNRNDPVMLQICNIQLRKNFSHLKLRLIGRNYFDPTTALAVPQHKLELWPGYATSIRQHETMTLMCVDLVFKVVRQDTVLDVLEDLYKADKIGFQQAAIQKLLGCVILTRYNNRTYRLDDVDWNGTPLDLFRQGDQEVSYVDYYQQHWGLKITDVAQPLLISRPKASQIRRGQIQNMVLIPELCTMTGLDESMRSNLGVMRDVAVHTRVEPEARVRSLQDYMKRLKNNEAIQAEMKSWGFEYAQRLVELQGRVLPQESIILPDRTAQYQPRTANWANCLRDSKMLSSVKIKKWLLLFPRSQVGLADNFARILVRIAIPMHIEVCQPDKYFLEDDRTATIVQTLKRNLLPSVQLVVVIVPNSRKDRYDAIKRICCVDCPVASQVILSRSISNPVRLMSIVTNIALQINCKLGGELWSVQIPLKKIMVAGFDTYHDSSQRGRSVGAVVCSTNERLTRYYSRTTFQANHQELADSLGIAFTAALKTYHMKNGYLPDRILFYRDGVGDGQISAVKKWELAQLLECFASVAPDYSPKFAFVVVNKRINTRLFSKQGNHAGNPMPGTVVDDVITRPERYDFFLVSQSVRQGTVAPTQYNVVYDTTCLKPDHMQRLTYKLTHLYYNWPGTIRVPAPCQYAHKLALLVGDSLHRDPHPDLADTLFYL